MITLKLTKPDGRVIAGRVAKVGAMLEVEPAEAAELLSAGAAELLLRIRLKRSFMIGSTVHAVGDLVDVPQEAARRYVEKGHAVLCELRALRPVAVGAASSEATSYGAEDVLKADIPAAVHLIGSGAATWAHEAGSARELATAGRKK